MRRCADVHVTGAGTSEAGSLRGAGGGGWGQEEVWRPLLRRSCPARRPSGAGEWLTAGPYGTVDYQNTWMAYSYNKDNAWVLL